MEMQRAIITRTAGFIELHPTELLLQKGYAVADFDGMTQYCNRALRYGHLDMRCFKFTRASVARTPTDVALELITLVEPDRLLSVAPRSEANIGNFTKVRQLFFICAIEKATDFRATRLVQWYSGYHGG